MELKDILNEIKCYPGITRKGSIGRVAEILKNLDEEISSQVVTGFGEDADIDNVEFDGTDVSISNVDDGVCNAVPEDLGSVRIEHIPVFVWRL